MTLPIRSALALLLSIAIGLAALSSAALARDSGKDDDTARVLGSLLDEFLAGASINDRATHEAFWADELIYTSSSGLRFGKADILAGLDAGSQASASVPIYSADDVTVQDFGELAVVTFRLLAHQDDELVAQYFNTGVFRRFEQGWRAVTWQATQIPPEASD
jgi:hypothetical protein